MSAAAGRENFGSARIYKSALLAVAMQWSLRLVGLFSVFILARLLTPQDFGIVGLATATVALVELFSVIGLRQALLRLETPERSHLDTAWTLQLIIFSGLAMVLLGLAPIAAWFYSEPLLGPVIAVLASRFLFLAIVNVGIVDFDRNLDFGGDMRMRLGARLAAFVFTVAFAVLLQSYWALVIGLVLSSAFFAAASYICHPYRPGLSLARRRELLGVSWWMFLTYCGQMIHFQFERLVIGRFASMNLVGFYAVSQDLASMFTQEISTALNRITFVTTAHSERPLSESAGRIGTMLGAYAMIAAPLGLGLAATSDAAVAVLLGPQWAGAAPLLELIAVASAFHAVFKVITTSFQAGGREKLAAGITGAGLGALALAVGLVVAWRGGAMAIATAALVVAAAMLVAGVIALAAVARASSLSFAAHIARPFLAAGLMLVAVRALEPSTGIPFADLAIEVILGAAVFAVTLGVIWIAAGRPAGAEAESLRLIAKLRERLARPALAGR